MEMSNPVAVAAIFLWIGFVCTLYLIRRRLLVAAQNPMAALAKSPKLSSRTINQLEFALAAIACGSLMIMKQPFASGHSPLFIAVCLLLIQSLWMLPALQKGENVYLNGLMLSKAGVRKMYAAAEIVKMASLVIFSIHLFNN